MNSGNFTLEFVVRFLLVASAFSSPIVKNTEGQYRLPPSFSDKISSGDDESKHKNLPLPLMNNQPITDDETALAYSNTNPDANIKLSENSDPNVADQLPVLRMGGSASSHFRFWKSVSRMTIPMVEFLRNSLERLVLNYCQDNSDVIPDDCLDFSFNLVNNWNVRDFIRSPSDEILTIKKQKKFDKKLLIDVIQVLRYNRRNLTDLLAIEKRHICGSEVACDVDCTSESSLYCSLNDIIVPNMNELILGLEKEAKMYFGARISRQAPQKMNPEKVKFYSKYRVFFVLGTMYNVMLQMFETEAALSYILDLSKITRLQVR